MTTRHESLTRTVLVPALAGGIIGGALARTTEVLSPPMSAPRLLVALAYGPFRDPDLIPNPVLAASLGYAATLTLLVAALRDPRWRPLATAVIAPALIATAFATGDVGPGWVRNEIRYFSHVSTEGFLFITLSALAWQLSIAVCLFVAWTRRTDRDGPSRDAAGDGRPRDAGVLVRLVRDAGPPLAAGAAFGYAVGSFLDAAAAVSSAPGLPLDSGNTTLRLFVGGPLVFASPSRFRAAAVFSLQAFVLWYACGGRRQRWLAAAWYVLALVVQGAFAFYWIGNIGFDRFRSFEEPGLRQIFSGIPGRMALLVAGVAGWHAYAIWCLFRYRSGRSVG